MSSSVSLAYLPMDVQFSILTHLDFKSLSLCPGVCKLWNKIIGKDNVYFWKCAYIQYLKDNSTLDKVTLYKVCEDIHKNKDLAELSVGITQQHLIKQLAVKKYLLQNPVENSEKPPEIAPNAKGFLSKCARIFKKSSSSLSAEKTEADSSEKVLKAFQDKHPSNGTLTSAYFNNPYYNCLMTAAQFEDLEKMCERNKVTLEKPQNLKNNLA